MPSRHGRTRPPPVARPVEGQRSDPEAGAGLAVADLTKCISTFWRTTCSTRGTRRAIPPAQSTERQGWLSRGVDGRHACCCVPARRSCRRGVHAARTQTRRPNRRPTRPAGLRVKRRKPARVPARRSRHTERARCSLGRHPRPIHVLDRFTTHCHRHVRIITGISRMSGRPHMTGERI